jgi:hypothetical protein
MPIIIDEIGVQPVPVPDPPDAARDRALVEAAAERALLLAALGREREARLAPP